MLEIYDNIKEQYTDNRLKLENIHKNEIKIILGGKNDNTNSSRKT